MKFSLSSMVSMTDLDATVSTLRSAISFCRAFSLSRRSDLILSVDWVSWARISRSFSRPAMASSTAAAWSSFCCASASLACISRTIPEPPSDSELMSSCSSLISLSPCIISFLRTAIFASIADMAEFLTSISALRSEEREPAWRLFSYSCSISPPISWNLSSRLR